MPELLTIGGGKTDGSMTYSVTSCRATRPHPEQTIVVEQEHDRIRHSLAQLSEDDQTILILRFVERKSHREVSQLLNKSVSAVKSAQHRALTRLANLLGEDKVRHYLRGNDD